jgi:hypothetical protein
MSKEVRGVEGREKNKYINKGKNKKGAIDEK